MKIRWTPEAAADLEVIADYIARESPEAALRVIQAVSTAINSLCAAPQRGRPGNVPGTRELVLSPLPYVVAYRVKDESIHVLHIWHGAQNWRN